MLYFGSAHLDAPLLVLPGLVSGGLIFRLLDAGLMSDFEIFDTRLQVALETVLAHDFLVLRDVLAKLLGCLHGFCVFVLERSASIAHSSHNVTR